MQTNLKSLGLRGLCLFLVLFRTQALDSHASYLRAYESFLLGQNALAETTVREAIALDPAIAENYQLLGRILLRMNRNAEAENAIRRAQQVRREAQELLALARSEAVLGAETAVQSVLEKASQNAERAKKAYYLGRNALRKGQWQSAAEHMFLAWSLERSNPVYANALANIYLDQGDTTAASDLYEQSLALNPNQREVYVSMVEALWEKAKPHQALHWVRRALKVYPADRILRDRELFLEHQSRLRLRIDGKDPYVLEDL